MVQGCGQDSVRVTPRPLFTRGEGLTVPIVREAEWALGLVWTQRLDEKSFASASDPTPVVQAVVRHYAD
jgi:hypothetical protein